MNCSNKNRRTKEVNKLMFTCTCYRPARADTLGPPTNSCWAREKRKGTIRRTAESMEQHPERRFLAGDRKPPSLPFWHERKKKRAKWMDRNGRRSLAHQCGIAGVRYPVDPSTRFLPKVFFPLWKGRIWKIREEIGKRLSRPRPTNMVAF